MAVILTAEESAAALKNWATKQIENLEETRGALGKFLLGVAGGSVGTLVTLSKATDSKWSEAEWLALVLFVACVGVGLALAIPAKYTLQANSDVQEIYGKMADETRALALLWCIFWIVGALVGGWGLSHRDADRPKSSNAVCCCPATSKP